MSKYTIIFAAIAGLVLALAPAAQAAITLQDSHTGDYRIAFATDRFTGVEGYAASSTAITAYDSDVTAAAAATAGATYVADISDLGTTWRVIGSTSDVDAKDHIDFGGANDVPIYNINGDRIADSNADLWDGALAAGIFQLNRKFNEYLPVWTGTQSDGTAATGLELGAANVAWGTSVETNSNWIWRFGNKQDVNTIEYQLYGLSSVIPEPATMALLAFGGLGVLIRRRRRA